MKCIMVALCLAVAVAFAMGAQTDVSAKSKVTCKLKKGTLTIKGKGNMPKKVKVNKKKVKKIVIKKGVKTISNNAFKGFTKAKSISIPKTVKKIGVNAFSKTAIKKLTIPAKTTKIGACFVDNCKKLDTLTIPGSFQIIDKNGAVKKKTYSMANTDLEDVIFNSNLDYNVVGYFRTINFTKASSDPKFKSFDGVIYTKDGTNLVRVPSARDTLTIKNGCTVFNTYAVTYCSAGSSTPACYDLLKITIPNSVSKVNEKNYPDAYATDQIKRIDINFDGDKLGMLEIVKLKNRFDMYADDLSKKLPTRIVKDEDGAYVGDNKYLVQGAQQTENTVPVRVTMICDKAFKGTCLNEVTLPNTCTEIGEYAFENAPLYKINNFDAVKKIGEGAFKGTAFTKIEIPASMTAVPDKLFYDTSNLSEITFKGDITSVGNSAFYNTRIDINEFLKNNKKLTTIADFAFFNVPWTNLTIPANITKIGDSALYEAGTTKFATVQGATAGYNAYTFGANMGITFQFTKGMSQAWIAPSHDYYKSGKKYKLTAWWDKVTDANGYEVWAAKDAKLTKGVQKFTAKYSERYKTFTIKAKKAKGLKYFGIRPYKTENGKKVYGKWTVDTL